LNNVSSLDVKQRAVEGLMVWLPATGQSWLDREVAIPVLRQFYGIDEGSNAASYRHRFCGGDRVPKPAPPGVRNARMGENSVSALVGHAK
jgi:hypothetical protein